MGKVTFIGAGPGDAGLITVKGVEALKKADVIIYDRLASEELLDYAGKNAVFIYVGKKPGAHSMKQEEINQVLVEQAKRYPAVVRLKGGDSFVFGRGGEEIEALEREKIGYDVIPGITSAVAVPESAGIPVTHRGISRSFHVITGHTKDGKENLVADFATLAKLEGTLVFLMGLSHLEQIAANLMVAGKAKETPAAVIASGTLPEERCVRGSLGEIAEKVRKAGLESPVVIVIGAAAALRFQDKRKKRVFGVAATQKTFRQFATGIMELGTEEAYEAVELLRMEKVKLPGIKELENIQEEMKKGKNSYDWIFFTSKQAVELFFQTADEIRLDRRRLADCRFAVLGKGTGAALENYGIYADFMPQRADGVSMAEEFVTAYQKEKESDKKTLRILLPRAGQGNEKTPEILQQAGFSVNNIAVYEVQGKTTEHWEQAGQIQDFVFFSASGVETFFEELQRTGKQIMPQSRCYCIGHLTEQALRRKSEQKKAPACTVYTAECHTVEGLLAMIEAMKDSRETE